MKHTISHYIILILSVCFFISCKDTYFELDYVNVESDTGNEIPQEGTVLYIASNWTCQTRFQFYYEVKYYKYRILIGDREAGGFTVGPYTYPDGHFKVAVPANDTYEPLQVRFQVDIGTDYGNWEYGEWKDLYYGIQKALPSDARQQYTEIDRAPIRLSIGDSTFVLDMFDNLAATCLRRYLSDNRLEINSLDNYYGEFYFTDPETGPDLGCSIPSVYHEPAQFRQKEYGMLFLVGLQSGITTVAMTSQDNYFHDYYSNITPLGRIAPDDLERWKDVVPPGTYEADSLTFGKGVKLELVL